MRRDKCDVFKIPNRMVKTNQDVTGEQCVRNHDGVGALSDEDKKITWKNYHENLLNTEFAYDRKSLSQADAVSGIPRLIDKDMVRESISKVKKW